MRGDGHHKEVYVDREGKKEKEKDLRTDPGGILFFKDLKNRAER